MPCSENARIAGQCCPKSQMDNGIVPQKILIQHSSKRAGSKVLPDVHPYRSPFRFLTALYPGVRRLCWLQLCRVCCVASWCVRADIWFPLSASC